MDRGGRRCRRLAMHLPCKIRAVRCRKLQPEDDHYRFGSGARMDLAATERTIRAWQLGVANAWKWSVSPWPRGSMQDPCMFRATSVRETNRQSADRADGGNGGMRLCTSVVYANRHEQPRNSVGRSSITGSRSDPVTDQFVLRARVATFATSRCPSDTNREAAAITHPGGSAVAYAKLTAAKPTTYGNNDD
jgi:hypothetical protein